MEQLTIVKVGGKIVEEPQSLSQLLSAFSQIEGHRILVHCGWAYRNAGRCQSWH